MTDDERNEYFANKKKEIIDSLLGTDSPYPIPDVVTVRHTIKNDGKTIYDRQRVLNNQNLNETSQKFLVAFNKEMRDSNGYIVTVDNTPIEDAVPPPVK